MYFPVRQTCALEKRIVLAALQASTKKTVRGRCDVDILDIVFGFVRQVAATLG